jgi:hypothetical protein
MHSSVTSFVREDTEIAEEVDDGGSTVGLSHSLASLAVAGLALL